MCMGQIIIEEKGPTGIGSPSAIMNYYDEIHIKKYENLWCIIPIHILLEWIKSDKLGESVPSNKK